MKVPYFDIRSHFLLWMILSKVLFNVYQCRFAVRHVDYRGEKDWWQICPDYTLFSLPVFHKKKARRGRWKSKYIGIFFEESTAASKCRRVSIKCI